jgi:hypothetical protein
VDPNYHVVKGIGEKTLSAKLCEGASGHVCFVKHNLHENSTQNKVDGNLLHSRQ